MIVCSSCAERLLSLVLAVQPSRSSLKRGLPATIIGLDLEHQAGREREHRVRCTDL